MTPETPPPDEDVASESQPGTSAGSTPAAGIKLRPEKLGQRYFFARWLELCDSDSPWWTRSPGVGIRMRLQELAQIAQAHQAGVMPPRALQGLQNEAREALLREGTYLQTRYPEIANELRHASRSNENAALVPGGREGAAIRAALSQLQGIDYLGDLVSSIAAAAELTDANRSDIDKIDALVELLDAELIFEGHSLAWRHLVAVEAQDAWTGGVSVEDAIASVLEKNKVGRERKFDVLFPLDRKVTPEGGVVGVPPMTPEEASNDVLRGWNQPELFAQLGAIGALRFEDQKAVDFEAAATLADDRFRQRAGLWRLRGGDLSRAEEVLVYDTDESVAKTVRLPTEPLNLLPDELDNYISGDERIDDAISQLAQAQAASPAAALADLWTAVEILFGGAITDPRFEISGTIGRLAKFLFVRDVLSWFGDRFSVAGIAPLGAAASQAGRAADTIAGGTSDVLSALVTTDDILGWVRLKRFLGWYKGPGLGREIEIVGEKTERICARAYLIRNFVVHQGQTARPNALAGTLPAFGSLVRACLGYAASCSPDTLQAAALASIRVNRLGNDVAARKAVLPQELINTIEE